ncbi:cytochrome p450 [Aureococcus anophagefferens]|nr:cytochrome p450 [Aureococcus anophagefferens]
MVAPARAGRWLALVVCQLLSVRPFMAPAVSPLAPRRVARSVMEKKADVVHTKEEKERELVEKALMDEWMTAWEDEKAQEGFDWEMEKLRRKLDDAPPPSPRAASRAAPCAGAGEVRGPKFWRRFIEAKPESTYGARFLLGNESEDGAAVAGWDWRGALERAGPGLMAKSIATGDLQTLVGGPLFLLLTKYHNELGPVFKLAFGPRSFIVVADPSIMRYILRDGAMNYDKGILAEILAPILGNGLIPADPDVWRRRRRVITPAFHKQWLASTLSLFDECDDGARALLLREFGHHRRAVFDYDFGSAKAESPLVRAVYRCLIEAEKRTTAFIPFWLIPGAQFLPSQVAFKNDLDLLNAKLDELVAQAFEEQIDDDDMLEAGQEVTKASTERISLLRFLVTIRGEEASTGQLRDDLMTMLVAGHETTAALLTWTLYELFHPSKRAAGHLERLRAEVDANFALRTSENRTATAYADVVDCAFARLCLAEGLRLYPQPPLLIRRALDSDELPQPYADEDRVKIARGTDVFMSTWSLHKNPALWDEPESFDPTRWERKKEGPDAPRAGAATTAKIPAQALYPTEQSADYAFLPFGAGNRRCVGDQFAILEATVMLTTLIREFDFEFALDDPSTLAPKTGLGGLPVADVGMRTGATIHTEHGLWMTAKPREHRPKAVHSLHSAGFGANI